MKKLLTAIIIMTVMGGISEAQNVDKIVTINGNEYVGYIAKQIPGKSITVVSNQSTVTARASAVRVKRMDKVILGTLSDAQISLFPMLSDDSYVENADIEVNLKNGLQETYLNSLILEKGEVFKFVCFARKTVEIPWYNVKLCQKIPYNPKSESGIQDILLLPSAELYYGQLLEQDIKNGLYKFFNKEDGQTTTYRKDQIQTIRYEVINKELTYWEQIPFCDRVIKNDNSMIEGFIESKQFGKNVIIRDLKTDVQHIVKISDIGSYEKFLNPQYKGALIPEDTLAETPELFINGEVRKACDISASKSVYQLDSPADTIVTKVNAGSSIVLQFKVQARTSKAHIAVADEKVVKVDKLTKARKLVFSTKNFLTDKTVDINFQTNDNKYIVCDFSIAKPGTYVFFVKGCNRCAVFRVVK